MPEATGDADVSDPVLVWDASHQARLDALVKRADGGDQAVLAGITQIFDTIPGVWDVYGNLATIAETALINLVAGNHAVTRKGLRKKLAAMREELAGPGAPPLERLLVERVVACWLQSYSADLAYARILDDPWSNEAEHGQRRQDRAARQYLKALRSLAMVRRLLVAPVQVNVAERQVNIAGQNVQVGSQD